MIEPYSEEEREYIRYLIRKYLPGVYWEDDDVVDTAVMFDEGKETLQKELEKTT